MKSKSSRKFVRELFDLRTSEDFKQGISKRYAELFVAVEFKLAGYIFAFILNKQVVDFWTPNLVLLSCKSVYNYHKEIMNMNLKTVASQIASLRKAKGLTQQELSERLNVTPQAVSKWERGETLPDIETLINLANVLETTTDNILMGGEKVLHFKGKISVADIVDGIISFEKFCNLIGKDTVLVRSAIDGINEKMNMDVESYITDEDARNAIIAEAIIENMMNGKYVDITDVKKHLNKHFAEIVCSYAEKYGLK